MVEATFEQEQRDEARARIGQTLLAKWRLDALLGVGGMAAVYSASHRNGIRGAVKMLHPWQSADPLIRQRFLREGYIANQVEHPGAVRVIDDDVTEDGQAFLVMELLEGQALHEMAAATRGVLDAERVLLVTDQLLEALASAHARGIVHRDVKPENVFLTLSGRVKILDFGIAGITEDAASGPRTTQVGTPMGTPAFMSPEQARGRWDLVGPQSDLWAVGATMFTLLTGRTVHEGETVAELLAAAITRPAPSLRDVAPGMPAAVVALVDRALAMRMADRWTDAASMREAVRDAYRVVSGRATIPPPPVSEQGVNGMTFRTGARWPRPVSTPDAASRTIHSVGTVVVIPMRTRLRTVGAAVGVALMLLLVALWPGRVATVGAATAAASPEQFQRTTLAPSPASEVPTGAVLAAIPPASSASIPAVRAAAIPAAVSAATSTATSAAPLVATPASARHPVASPAGASPAVAHPATRPGRPLDLDALYDRRH